MGARSRATARLQVVEIKADANTLTLTQKRDKSTTITEHESTFNRQHRFVDLYVFHDDMGGRSSREEGLTTATLLVSGWAPPMPSIWRASGEPMADSSTASRLAISAGRSSARKNSPFEVPPRIAVQGMAFSILLFGQPARHIAGLSRPDARACL